MPDVHHMRAVMNHGELYLCRSDLLEVISRMAGEMPDLDDREIALNLVRWLRQQSDPLDGGMEATP
jgi:hypothetical protein